MVDAKTRDWLERLGGDRLVDVVAIRTRWFDDAVREWARRGIRTVVTLGVGLDTRHRRLGLDGIRFVEVDRAQVLKHRSSALGLPPHEGDVISGDLREARTFAAIAPRLKRRGASPYLFVVEGLLAYLPEHAATQFLKRVARLCTQDSVVLFDVPDVASVDFDGPLAKQLSQQRDLGAPLRFGVAGPIRWAELAGLRAEAVSLGSIGARLGRLSAEIKAAPRTFLATARVRSASGRSIEPGE